MRFWLLGLAVVLAAQLAAAAAASLVVAWAHRTSRSRLARLAAAARAERLLALALFPAAAGLATAVAVALAWLVHEPRSTGESPGPVLLALALLGLMVLASRAAAVVGDAVRTHGLVKSFRLRGPRDGRAPTAGLARRPRVPGRGAGRRVAAAAPARRAGAARAQPGGARRRRGARARAPRRAGQPEAPAAGGVPRPARPHGPGPASAVGVPGGRRGRRRRPCLRQRPAHGARPRHRQGRGDSCPRVEGSTSRWPASTRTGAWRRACAPSSRDRQGFEPWRPGRLALAGRRWRSASCSPPFWPPGLPARSPRSRRCTD